MKLVLIVLTLFVNIDIVEQLNKSTRNLEFCDDQQQLNKWNIDCSSTIIIRFNKATKINTEQSEYLLEGLVSAYDEPLPGVRIRYGDYKDTTCKLEKIGITDEKGIFKIKAKLNQNKIIEYQMVGFASTTILLNVEK
ncbi:MAG: hypothetical protein KF732_02830 [Flavobacteriales bacterium]|nr:hypothetical protein [Flavobacteriales bacterium]